MILPIGKNAIGIFLSKPSIDPKKCLWWIDGGDINYYQIIGISAIDEEHFYGFQIVFFLLTALIYICKKDGNK